MNEIGLIYEIIIIFIAGFIGGYGAIKLKQPIILGYIVAGAVLGLPFLQNRFALHNSAEIAEVGAGLLLFAVGVEFSLEKLEKVKKTVLIGGSLQIILTIVISLLLFNFKYSLLEAFFLGSVISLSSTAVVIKLLEEKHRIETKSGNIMLGWLILQDIAVVFIVITLQNFAKGGDINLGSFFNAFVKSFLLIAVALILSKTAIPAILRRVAKMGSREILLIVSFLLPLILALIAEKLGLSFTLGAFLAGIMISESFVNHEVFSEVRPVRDIFALIFFITIGTLFSFNFFFEHIFEVILFTVLILVIKALIILTINLTINRLHPRVSFKIALGLAQIGEFAFLISKIMYDSHLIDENLNSLIISATTISFVLSPLLLNKSDDIYYKVKNFVQRNHPYMHRKLFMLEENDIDQPEFKKHIVLCGHGRVGTYVAEALLKLKIPFISIDIDSEKVEQLRSQGIKIIYGDATNKEILDSADVERASAIILALPHDQDVRLIGKLAKELNPKIKVLARSGIESQPKEEDSGIDNIVNPEFETALSLVHNIMIIRGEKNKKVLYWLRNIKELKALHEQKEQN